MPDFAKSTSMLNSCGPHDTLLEAQKQVEEINAALRSEGLAPDPCVVHVAPPRTTAIAERRIQGSKRLPASGGRERTAGKKRIARKRNPKRGC